MLRKAFGLTGRRWQLLLALLAAMWSPFLIYLFTGMYLFRWLASGTIIIGALVGIVLMFLWRGFTPALLIVISPPTLNFSYGIAEWFRERPSIFGWGLPSASACNLDPESRCYFATGGCVIVGGEWVFDTPHNLGLRLMTTVFGKPPKVYHGPYPDEKAVKKLTDSAVQTTPEHFLRGELIVSGKAISIDQKVPSQILNDLDESEFQLGDSYVERSVYAAIYNERCLIIRVKTKNTLLNAVDKQGEQEDRSNHDGCILFDLKTMRAFARYSFHGYVPRFARLLSES
jgi:hypothetical protein